MDPLRSQFEDEHALLVRQLLRDKHHGFSPAWRVEHNERRLERLDIIYLH